MRVSCQQVHHALYALAQFASLSLRQLRENWPESRGVGPSGGERVWELLCSPNSILSICFCTFMNIYGHSPRIPKENY